MGTSKSIVEDIIPLDGGIVSFTDKLRAIL